MPNSIAQASIRRWLAPVGLCLGLGLGLGAGCDDSDDDGGSASLVEVWIRGQDCGFITEGGFPVLTYAPGPWESCVYGCRSNARCDELELLVCTGAYNSGSELEACEQQCLTDHGFVCADGTTIPIEWKCDAFQDCEDGSDEVNCASLAAFTCNDGNQIPKIWVCDGELACPDGSDELDCPTFACGDQTNVLAIQRCDGNLDCADGSDEANCAGLQCN